MQHAGHEEQPNREEDPHDGRYSLVKVRETVVLLVHAEPLRGEAKVDERRAGERDVHLYERKVPEVHLSIALVPRLRRSQRYDSVDRRNEPEPVLLSLPHPQHDADEHRRPRRDLCAFAQQHF